MRLATYVGVIVALATFFLILFYIISFIFFGSSWPPGFTTLSVLLLFSISMMGIFMGILGEYIARIYKQSLRMPTVIIEKTVNLDLSEDRER